MQRIILLCLLTIALDQGFSQIAELRPLTIGDTLPEVSFQKFLKSSLQPVQVADLRGKLVILDFWNIGCLACLKSMPAMDSLQKQFKDNIQVIMVTNNTEEQVNKLFSRIKIKKPDIPIVVEDTIYYKTLFPHVGDPLHVWIDQKGVIAAITDGHNATVSNIQSMLTGEKLKLYSRPLDAELKINNSLLEASAGSLKNVVSSYSIFFKYLYERTTDNRLKLFRDSSNQKLIGVSAVNIPLIILYSLAFSKDLFGFDINVRNLRYNNRILIQTKNALDIRYATVDSTYDEWNKRNLVSYETAIDSESVLDILSIIQADLKKYTMFNASIETKEINCLVLKRTSKKDKLRTKQPEANPESFYSGFYSVTNKPLSASLLPDLVIAYQTGSYPIVDETAYNASVDMVLSTKLNDLSSLRKELNKYDLDLVMAKRSIKMLVITDRKRLSPY